MDLLARMSKEERGEFIRSLINTALAKRGIPQAKADHFLRGLGVMTMAAVQTGVISDDAEAIQVMSVGAEVLSAMQVIVKETGIAH